MGSLPLSPRHRRQPGPRAGSSGAEWSGVENRRSYSTPTGAGTTTPPVGDLGVGFVPKRRAGIDPTTVSGHSLRAGLATLTAAVGL